MRRRDLDLHSCESLSRFWKIYRCMQKGTGAKCCRIRVRACVFGLIVYLKVYVLLLKINENEKANQMNLFFFFRPSDGSTRIIQLPPYHPPS